MSEEDLIPVINLPDPKPAVAARNDGDPTVPTVPDDILREISTFLGFNDRLALSLTSHHIYDVVQPRLEEVAVNEPQLPAFHRWVFENPVARASQLRVLRFDAPMNPESVRFCLDIIKKATKLEVLSCSSSLSKALRTKHLRAFTNLRHLWLWGCTAEMLKSLRLPTTLTKLHLSYPPIGTVCIFRRILLSIAHLQALTTLVLEGLTFPDPDDEEAEDEEENDIAEEAEDAEEDEDADGDADGDANELDADEAADQGGDHNEGDDDIAPVLTSLHTLKLLDTELPPSVDWATTLPALRTVVLNDSMHLTSNVYATKPLQHLIVEDAFEGNYVPWQVNRLTYVPGFTEREGLDLDAACEASTLVALSLRLIHVSSAVWDAVINSASDVRLLEIESLGVALSEVIWLFYELLRPDSPLDDVPLLCLSIVAAASPTQAPEEREQCRIEFLDHAFKSLPSLRYVALAEPPGERAGNLLRKEEYAGNAAPWRWWRVVRDEDGSPVEVREIPGWEGERVRSYLRNADRKAADNFNDEFVALR
ncbi:hypothetical protein C8T65DRAFT_836558 [Cerioporus squamosus]|nr:hypothetical protein C8T65DRAFT_836558 [Cerioporus squamosus]